MRHRKVVFCVCPIQADGAEQNTESNPNQRMETSAYATYLLLRPIAAVVFTLSTLFIGWFLAWKLVLVHVPLVQEIFGLRKKPVKPKPAGRRKFTQFYNRIDGQAFSSSDW